MVDRQSDFGPTTACAGRAASRVRGGVQILAVSTACGGNAKLEWQSAQFAVDVNGSIVWADAKDSEIANSNTPIELSTSATLDSPAVELTALDVWFVMKNTQPRSQRLSSCKSLVTENTPDTPLA